MSEQRYWYGIDGERQGPVSLEEIHEMVRGGRLRPTDYIWNEEHQVWTRVTDFLGVSEGKAPPPPREGPGFGTTRDGAGVDADFEDSPPSPERDTAGARRHDHAERHQHGWGDEGDDAGYAAGWSGAPEYAGFWTRVGAHLIDSFLLSAIGMVWFFLAMALGLLDNFMALESGGAADDIFEIWDSFPFSYYAVSIIIAWVYEATFISSSWMATPGKRAMGIVVVNAEGGRCGFGQASIRYILKMIFASFTFGMSYLVIAFTEKKQGLHDFVAQTFCEKT